MINTVQIKQQQLEKGFFTIGSGPEVILVMGSCRVVNFVTYLSEYSAANGNRFTIHSLDPFNFHWDEKDNRVDYAEALKKWEVNESMLTMLKSVKYFIHEWYQNLGMFNTFKNEGENIYEYGLKPEMDICIPNWNDVFVLFGDIVTFDSEIRKRAIQDYNVLGKLSEQTKKEIHAKGILNLEKFYDVCRKSDFPEMEQLFKEWHKTLRLFWSYNHTSKYFTLAIFQRMNERFLKLDLLLGYENHEDIFANNYTKLTEYDVEMYGYDWGEEIIPLKDKLF